MNVESARGGLAALNLVLTAGLLGLGYFTFLTKHVPGVDERVPAYNPTMQSIPIIRKPADPLKEFQPIWQALDKPPPPPEPKPVEAPPVVAQDLSAKFTLVLVDVNNNPEDPKSNYCIIQRKENEKAPDAQQLFHVGQNLEGAFSNFKVVKIEARIDPKTTRRIAIVTLEDPKKLDAKGQPTTTAIQLTPAE